VRGADGAGRGEGVGGCRAACWDEAPSASSGTKPAAACSDNTQPHNHPLPQPALNIRTRTHPPTLTRGAQVYRDKVRAEVEGKPFSAPPPGSIKVDLSGAPPTGSAANSRPASSGRPAPGIGSNGNSSHDNWGDWGASGGGGGGAAASGGSASNGQRSGSEYTMSQLQASAAVKDAFFERRLQENASRPDGLPPSQGGKYVGFGSTPAPRPGAAGRPGGGAATDDVGLLLSKGLQTLTVAAGTATNVLRQGTAQVSTLLVDKQVTEQAKQTAAQLQEKGTALASAGWTGLQRLYANVAATVESAAKDNGLQIDLGARQVAAQLHHSASAGGGYGGGGGSNNSMQHMQHSASDGRLLHHPQHPQQQSWQQPQQQQQASGGSGFSGFDNGAGGNGNGWDDWGGHSATSNGSGRAGAAVAQRSGLTPQKSISSPDVRSKAAAAEADDWGKW